MTAANKTLASAPVDFSKGEESSVEAGIALCLSGGGYRAMLFHLGALLRLNELGTLASLTRVSSVSGGSITAAVLGTAWQRLEFRTDQDGRSIATNFVHEVVEPVRRLASKTIDQGAILSGLLSPGTISDKVIEAYDEVLFHGQTLQDLPDNPRFVINASNVQTGALWRFSKPYMADYLVGQVLNPDVSIALAVAASSAFPPLLSPCRLEIPEQTEWSSPGPLHRRPYTTDVVLSDGGVYDNLGLETAWKRCLTVLVSDGGGQMAPEPEPKADWARHALRINSLIDNQVRSLRKRQTIAGFEDGERKGTYWGIRSHVADYGLSSGLECPPDRTLELAELQTRLKRIEDSLQARIINWGYAICDVAMRRWVLAGAASPARFPYDGGV